MGTEAATPYETPLKGFLIVAFGINPNSDYIGNATALPCHGVQATTYIDVHYKRTDMLDVKALFVGQTLLLAY